MQTSELQLILNPFVCGVANKRKLFIGSPQTGRTLGISAAEYSLVAYIDQNRPTLTEFLNHTLAGQSGVTFKQAVNLLALLHGAEMFANPSPSLALKLREVSEQNARIKPESATSKWLAKIKSSSQATLLEMTNVLASPGVRAVAAGLIAPLSILAMIIICLAATLAFHQRGFIPDKFLGELLVRPEIFLIQAVLSITFATNVTAVAQAILALGTGVISIRMKFKLFLLVMPILVVDDEPTLLTTARASIFYQVAVLIFPALCFLGLSLANTAGELEAIYFMAMGFGVVGLWQTCPFYRSPLVKISEAWLVEKSVLTSAYRYLMRGILADLIFQAASKPRPNMEQERPDQPRHIDIWSAAYATYALAWLYFFGLSFFDVLIEAIPELLYRTNDMSNKLGALSSGLLVIVLTFSLVTIAATLLTILGQNVLSATATPLRKARRSILEFRSQKIPVSQAVSDFLMAIPVLSHIPPLQLNRLTELLSFQDYQPGQTIIQQGERGDRFFIMALGEAKISTTDNEGKAQYIGTLRPGDSFGEIALIRDVERQASVIALTACRVIVLKRASFDLLFRPGSVERETLTQFLDLTRLVQDSQALSYLTPVQVHRLVRHSQTVTFELGDTIIKEGVAADTAYLLIDGAAEVSSSLKEEKVATLERGDLFGMIALVKSIPRTASVRATMPSTCLKISKDVLLTLCIENLYVGSLITELSDRQLSELQPHSEVS